MHFDVRDHSKITSRFAHGILPGHLRPLLNRKTLNIRRVDLRRTLMRQKIISVSKAKAKLLELIRNVNEGGYAYLLTKDGEPVSALIPLQVFWVLSR